MIWRRFFLFSFLSSLLFSVMLTNSYAASSNYETKSDDKTNNTYADSGTDPIFVVLDKEQSINVDLFQFDNIQQQQQAISLAKSLRCPQCQNQNLIESNSPIARDLRLKVFQMYKEGKSEQEIIDYMTYRFGDFVLYNPKLSMATLLLWGAPLLLLLLLIFYSFRGIINQQQK